MIHYWFAKLADALEAVSADINRTVEAKLEELRLEHNGNEIAMAKAALDHMPQAITGHVFSQLAIVLRHVVKD